VFLTNATKMTVLNFCDTHKGNDKDDQQFNVDAGEQEFPGPEVLRDEAIDKGYHSHCRDAVVNRIDCSQLKVVSIVLTPNSAKENG
jgi:hypothetical protein